MGSDRAEHIQVIVEPPRDGEFFLDEEYGVDERLAGAIDRGATGITHFILRFPGLSIGLAVVFGVVVSTAVFELFV